MKYFGVMLLINLVIFPFAVANTTCNPDVDYMSRGKQVLQTAQLARALQNFDCAVELDPINPEAYFYRAVVHKQLTNYPEALADADKVTELTSQDMSPFHIYARLFKAQLYDAMGEFDAALTEYNTLIDLISQGIDIPVNVGVSALYIGRARVYANLGDDDLALADLNHAIELDSTQAIAYADRGFIYQKSGNQTQAEQDWATALELSKDVGEVYRPIGIDYCNAKNYERCIEYFTRFFQLSQETTLVDYVYRGTAYLYISHYEQAIADLNTALELDSTAVHILFFRGQAYQGLEAYDLALADFDHYIELNPFVAETYFFRAEVFYALEDFESATRDYEYYLQLAKAADQYVTLARERLKTIRAKV